MSASISIIIPTWERKDLLGRIIVALENQTENTPLFEVIVVDSKSNDGTHDYISSKIQTVVGFELSIRQCPQNVLAAKRNLGISIAKSERLVFLDDDCVPNSSFVLDHFIALENNHPNTIFSGIVIYPSHLLKTSNYTLYRQNRHFTEVDDEVLSAPKIVVMNMGCWKDALLDHSLRFNELFLGYGFEDYDFGKRALAAGFKLKKGKATICHEEVNSSLAGYLKKIEKVGDEGMTALRRNSCYEMRDMIFVILDDSTLFNLFVRATPRFLLRGLIRSFVLVDKTNVVSFDLFYFAAVFFAFSLGTKNRTRRLGNEHFSKA